MMCYEKWRRDLQRLIDMLSGDYVGAVERTPAHFPLSSVGAFFKNSS